MFRSIPSGEANATKFVGNRYSNETAQMLRGVGYHPVRTTGKPQNTKTVTMTLHSNEKEEHDGKNGPDFRTNT